MKMKFLKNLVIPRSFYLVGALIFLVAMAGVLIRLMWPDPGQASSSARAFTPRNLETIPGGQGTPDYNRMIDELNQDLAEEASRQGKSYVPTPVGDPQSSQLPVDLPEAPPASTVPTPRVGPRVDKREVVVNEPPRQLPRAEKKKVQEPVQDHKGLVNDLKNLLDRKLPPLLPVVSYTGETPVGTGNQPILDDHQDAASVPKTGEMLYAVNDLTINSDVPSPVSATVIQGPYKGARLLGAFKLHGQAVVMAYSRLVPPSGQPLEIEAVAVDPRTSSVAVAAQVNTHFFHRWGGLLAAGFLEGFGSALGHKNVRVYTSSDVVVEDGSGLSYEEAALEALGKVGGRAANQLERGFDRPPTVTVKSGQPLGILVLGTGR